MEGCYRIGQSWGLKLNTFLHQMAHKSQILLTVLPFITCTCIPRANPEQQPHVCALSWEGEQEAEQQTVPFLPSFEEAFCSQVSQGTPGSWCAAAQFEELCPKLTPPPTLRLCLTKRCSATVSVGCEYTLDVQ